MPKIRTAIIDDEPFARERVRRLLANEPEIEIVGEAGDGIEAVSLIKKKLPMLIFLDVQMPGKNGFEVLAELQPEETPVVVFLTAFDKYAVKAFEAAALDYLLKPFDEERFNKTIDRAKSQLQTPVLQNQSETSEIFRSDKGFLERILVKKGGRVYFFKTDEIVRIEAYGNYVRLHFEKTSHLLRETISNLEMNLNPEKFVRVHRSGLVNIKFIREIHPIFGGRAIIILANGEEMITSRRYNRKLSKLFDKT